VPVEISVVERGHVRPIKYSPEFFDYSKSRFQPAPGADYGFSGFRLLADGLRHELEGEFIVFQGASYFRARGKGMAYGLSARGLAIGSGRPKEEFPLFRHFWIVRPEPWEHRSMRVYALLDSESVAGAYRFGITPGAETVLDIDTVLFPRADIAHAGVAPLTSMFLFGAAESGRFTDFRSAVHDSDALSISLENGKRLHRPLKNPRKQQITSFPAVNPIGFGLLQTERDFTLFQDLQAQYHKRPSAWVTPSGRWGAGEIVLVELTSGAEWGDNIVAFWQPRGGLAAGKEYRFSYHLRWFDTQPAGGGTAQVAMSRQGQQGGRPQFIVEFDRPFHGEPVKPVAIATQGKVAALVGQINKEAQRYRVNLVFDPQQAAAARLELHLQSRGERISDIWVFDWRR
jgi:glucans biosynthesis protein